MSGSMNVSKTRRIHVYVAGIVAIVSIVLTAIAGYGNYQYIYQLELEGYRKRRRNFYEFSK